MRVFHKTTLHEVNQCSVKFYIFIQDVGKFYDHAIAELHSFPNILKYFKTSYSSFEV